MYIYIYIHIVFVATMHRRWKLSFQTYIYMHGDSEQTSLSMAATRQPRLTQKSKHSYTTLPLRGDGGGRPHSA